ncbi:hypothetical protein PSI22_20885 [Xenorhabdus sp. XENO-7]|uniref:Uncharacterized protein n=1 Tax=Xenorhabdus aichiensis TaxID=3025874 RepID=A0ABT5M8J4_9GAMM|nr:hypothetical protein [Xenorhabdus aichiensis]MDC9624016.1 hypothetical protein [Xenorhabdus aichiensis]
MQRGRGGGGKTAEAAGRPAFRGVCRTVARQLKKKRVRCRMGHGVPVRRCVCRGLAPVLTAEGAALCGGTPAMPISGGARHNVYYTLRTAAQC